MGRAHDRDWQLRMRPIIDRVCRIVDSLPLDRANEFLATLRQGLTAPQSDSAALAADLQVMLIAGVVNYAIPTPLTSTAPQRPP